MQLLPSPKEAVADPTWVHLSLTTRYSFVADFCIVENVMFMGSVNSSNYT